MKARLGGYALWQLRDFVFERAAAIVVVNAAYLWVGHQQVMVANTPLAQGGEPALEVGRRLVAQHLGSVWFICALIAVNGISANDRTSGRFRLLFAKPVNVLHFYGQAFALHGAAFMVGTAAALAALTRMVPVNGSTLGSALVILLVSYLLVGGIGFLFSAIWRFDWLSTGGAFGAALYLAASFPNARWLGALPPFWRIFEQIELIKASAALEARSLLWIAAYGVACFLLGLIILKRRPLAI